MMSEFIQVLLISLYFSIGLLINHFTRNKDLSPEDDPIDHWMLILDLFCWLPLLIISYLIDKDDNDGK